MNWLFFFMSKKYIEKYKNWMSLIFIEKK
jgi:hypothetical protein